MNPYSFRLAVVLVAALLIAACVGDKQVELNLNIDDQATVSDRLLRLSGTVKGAPEGTLIILNGNEQYSAPAASDGTFTLPPYLLNPGANALQVGARHGGVEFAMKSLSVTYEDGQTVSKPYDPAANSPVQVTIEDETNPAFGAAIAIPSGSLDVEVDVGVTSDAEHMPNLPLGVKAVGNPITFQPIGQSFTQDITLTIPFNPALVPEGREADLVVYAMSDAGWEKIAPSSISSGTVTVSLKELFFDPFVVVLEEGQPAGSVILQTSPSGATAYVDGVKKNSLTPMAVTDVSPGGHEAKFYIPGYNELFTTFTTGDQGQVVQATLTRIDESLAPVVSIDDSIPSELTVEDNVFTLSGQITVQTGASSDVRLVLSLNGVDSFISVSTDGSFEHSISLASGANAIQLRATDSAGNTGLSRAITVINAEGTDLVAAQSFVPVPLAVSAAQVAAQSQSITAILTWDKNDTDVDLHMYDPEGNHAWYQDFLNIPGAQLDIDDTDGFGPETFSYPSPVNGEYRAEVHYYSDHSNGPTTANLSIRVGNIQIFSGSRLLSDGDIWDAHTFEIDEFSIVSVNFSNGEFTTESGENQLIVTLNVPSSINPAEITFEVIEIVEDHAVEVAGGADSNGQKTIELTHEPLQALTNPASHSLKYRVIAHAGEQSTDPIEFEQDVRSQIRQEYVDKREFNAIFTVPTPDRADIITSADFPAGANYFTFDEFSRYSDYGPTYAIIDNSLPIAESLRNDWGFPLRITSGWRNPRRNDSLGPSSINSLHQTGDAVDFNPSRNRANWPDNVRTYVVAQRALTLKAQQTFGEGYDILFHANHLHVEYDP